MKIALIALIPLLVLIGCFTAYFLFGKIESDTEKEISKATKKYRK